MERSIRTEGVRWLDLGPSGNPAVAQLKAKYGFTNTDGWRSMCDYSGDFKEVTEPLY